MATAHQEFVAVRLDGKDTTGSQPGRLPSSSVVSSSSGAPSPSASSAPNSTTTGSNAQVDVGTHKSGGEYGKARQDPFVIAVIPTAVAATALAF